MPRRMDGRFLTHSALLTAAGILLPAIFHAFGVAGKIFLPMHFPVIIAGMMLGPLGGLIVGGLSPSLSALLTGMPPFPMAVLMIPELMIYGLASGVLYRNLRLNIFVALIISMALGRIALGVSAWALAGVLGLHAGPVKFVVAGVATGLPGIVAQIALIPVIVRRLTPGHGFPPTP